MSGHARAAGFLNAYIKSGRSMHDELMLCDLVPSHIRHGAAQAAGHADRAQERAEACQANLFLCLPTATQAAGSHHRQQLSPWMVCGAHI